MAGKTPPIYPGQYLSPVAGYVLSHKDFVPLRTMTSPPTITFGGNSSSVNGSYVNGATLVNAQDSRLQHLGSIFTNGTSGGGYPNRKPTHITASTGTKSGGTAPIRVRFMTDAPEFDVCFLDVAFAQFNIVVDGEIAYRDKCLTFTNSGNYRYVKVSFGANTTTYSKAQTNFAITAVGSGYAVGDIITLNGGTGGAAGTACTVKVTQVSSGVVSGVDIVNPGAYTTQPTGTFAQASTTGGGVGFQATAQFFSKNYTTRKMRAIELIYHEPVTFMGIVTRAEDSILPFVANSRLPKLSVIGDSITIGTYLEYGGSHIGATMAQILGLWDNAIISGIGGTGWNAGATPWSHANRIQDFLDYNSDIYVFVGSQNDTAGTALEGKIRDVLDAILAARPRALIVGIGNVLGDSTSLATSIANGFALASDQSRVRFCNNHSPTKWIPSTYQSDWYVTSDSSHLSQDGMDRFARIAAEAVWTSLNSMVT